MNSYAGNISIVIRDVGTICIVMWELSEQLCGDYLNSYAGYWDYLNSHVGTI